VIRQAVDITEEEKFDIFKGIGAYNFISNFNEKYEGNVGDSSSESINAAGGIDSSTLVAKIFCIYKYRTKNQIEGETQ